MKSLFPILLLVASFPALSTAGEATVSFNNDVLPILTRAGCVAGSCHAKSDGQNGFQLSVFSYDTDSDYREIVYDARGRRIFPSSPDYSLLLLKATNAIPHEGEKRFEKDSEFYKTLRQWIAEGAPRSIPNEPTLTEISVSPEALSFKKGQTLPIKVTAHYSDKSSREITDLSEFTSNDENFAKVDHHGHITAGNVPGENSIIVRYLDRVGVARVVIPPDVVLPAEKYSALPTHNEVDKLAYTRFRELGLFPSEPCTDPEFIRRSTLDVLGRLPTLQTSPPTNAPSGSTSFFRTSIVTSTLIFRRRSGEIFSAPTRNGSG